MHPIKRVLVGLDLTEMDTTIISYTSYLSDILGFDKIYFFHICPNLELPEEVLSKYPNLLAPVDETLINIIKDKVKAYYTSDTEYSIEVHEGNAEDKILRWSDIKEVDLIVVGKKNTLKGSGLLPNRLAKIGHCSILSVPEGAKPKISKIIVPVDFSSSSKFAIKEANTLAEKTKSRLTLHNVYTVPTGYHTSGKTYEEFADIIKDHAQKDAINFLKTLNIDHGNCKIHLSLDEDKEPADKIYKEALATNSDLILISSKGRTGLANILLGSVADKVLAYKGAIPVLVVKNKKENLSFLEALLRV